MLDVVPLKKWDARVCGEVFEIIELRVSWPGPYLGNNSSKKDDEIVGQST